MATPSTILSRVRKSLQPAPSIAPEILTLETPHSSKPVPQPAQILKNRRNAGPDTLTTWFESNVGWDQRVVRRSGVNDLANVPYTWPTGMRSHSAACHSNI